MAIPMLGKSKSPITLDALSLNLSTATADEVIAALVESVRNLPLVTDAEMLLRQALQREQEMSTYFGELVAFPHARTPSVERIVIAAGRLETPIAWGDADHQVQLVFLLGVPPTAIEAYLATMRQVAYAFKRQRMGERLLAAANDTAFRDEFNLCIAGV